MTALDLPALLALAEAAVPGPWMYEDRGNGHAPLVIGDGLTVAETFDKPHHSDAAFIAAANPAVKALVERLQAAEAAVERVEALAAAWEADDRKRMDREIAAATLRAALESR